MRVYGMNAGWTTARGEKVSPEGCGKGPRVGRRGKVSDLSEDSWRAKAITPGWGEFGWFQEVALGQNRMTLLSQHSLKPITQNGLEDRVEWILIPCPKGH